MKASPWSRSALRMHFAIVTQTWLRLRDALLSAGDDRDALVANITELAEVVEAEVAWLRTLEPIPARHRKGRALVLAEYGHALVTTAQRVSALTTDPKPDTALPLGASLLTLIGLASKGKAL